MLVEFRFMATATLRRDASGMSSCIVEDIISS